jgi:hypothetical protein
MGESDPIATQAVPAARTGSAEVRSPSIVSLGLWCVLGASITAALFLIACWLRAPDYGDKSEALEFLFDPLVLGVALPVAGIGAAFAFFLSFVWHGHVEPESAVKFTYASTWCATVLGTFAFGKYGVLIALGALLASSLSCRFVVGPSRAMR